MQQRLKKCVVDVTQTGLVLVCTVNEEALDVLLVVDTSRDFVSEFRLPLHQINHFLLNFFPEF